MATLISHSPADTEALGETWGRRAAGGLVIALIGDLGAGKTQIVRGIARGLDITKRVHSPTFALVNVYSGGRLLLHHLDLYRLDGPADIVAAGMEDYLEPAGVTVIEWADKWFAKPSSNPSVGVETPKLRAAPAPAKRRLRWVEIEILSETGRRIRWDDFQHEYSGA
jgi:tRNA threonylcarbamoyladenosine biosynthesis protein TsaE